MKKLIYILTIIILTAGTFSAQTNAVRAAEIPGTGQTTATLVDTKIEDESGWRLLTKTFEALPDYKLDYSSLIDEPFEYEGYYYTFFYASINEIMRDERKWERAEINFPIEEDDVSLVFAQLAPSLPYDQDGFTGVLDLDYKAVWTQIEGYTQKSFTMTDTVTVSGLSSNDSSQIEKTRVKSGVTLKLQSVDWTVQESTNIGYDTVPTKYTATAKYSGTYTKQVPSGYIGRAWYGGEVVRMSVDKVIYTIIYAGISLAEPVSDNVTEPGVVQAAETEPKKANEISQALEQESKENEIIASAEAVVEQTAPPVENISDTSAADAAESGTESSEQNGSFILMLAVIASALALACIALLVVNRNNVSVYSVEGDDQTLIAKRRITSKNPVVDLRSLKIMNAALSVEVKRSAAAKLYDRQIRIIINDSYSSRHRVNTRDSDLVLSVNVIDGGKK